MPRFEGLICHAEGHEHCSRGNGETVKQPRQGNGMVRFVAEQGQGHSGSRMWSMDSRGARLGAGRSGG